MSLLEEALLLQRAAHDLMYLGMDGSPIYSDDLSRRNSEVYRLTTTLYNSSIWGTTVEEQANERKLRHRQDLAADVAEREVRLPVFICKNPKLRDFRGKPPALRLAVALSDAEEHQKSPRDFADGLPADRNPCAEHALNHSSHAINPFHPDYTPSSGNNQDAGRGQK